MAPRPPPSQASVSPSAQRLSLQGPRHQYFSILGLGSHHPGDGWPIPEMVSTVMSTYAKRTAVPASMGGLEKETRVGRGSRSKEPAPAHRGKKPAKLLLVDADDVGNGIEFLLGQKLLRRLWEQHTVNHRGQEEAALGEGGAVWASFSRPHPSPIPACLSTRPAPQTCVAMGSSQRTSGPDKGG